MSSSRAKAALKDAKNAIKDKNYPEALRFAQDVLSEESNNYTALVFAGVAQAKMEKWGDAEASYRKAIAVDPTQGLAWQGISGLYETAGDKLPNKEDDLVKAYEQCLVFSASDEGKSAEIRGKLVALLETSGRFGDAAAVLAGSPGEKGPEAIVKVFSLFSAQSSALKARHSKDNLTKAQFNRTVYEGNLAVFQGYMTACGDLLRVDGLSTIPQMTEMVADALTSLTALVELGRTDMPTLCETTAAFVDKLPESPFPLEHLCRIAQYDQTPLSQEQVTTYLQLLADKFPASPYGKVALAQRLLPAKTDEAAVLLREATKQDDSCLLAFLALSEALLRAYALEAAHDAAERGLALVRRMEADSGVAWWKSARLRLLLAAGTCCLNASSLPIAKAYTYFTAATELSPSSEAARVGLAEVLHTRGEASKAQEVCEALLRTSPDCHGAKAALGWVHFRAQRLEQAEAELAAAIALDGEVASYHFRLGSVLWAGPAAKKGDALGEFLKAAKLDPNNPDTFAYLGHCYRATNAPRAQKCYEKAVALNPAHDEAGEALWRMLMAGEDKAPAQRLVADITSKVGPGRAKWAWLRLGLFQMEQLRDASAAVVSLQNALKADSADPVVWELIADAYSQRGSHVASLKALTRALELSPTSVYCMHRIACENQALGQDTDAIAAFQRVIALHPTYVPARQGYADVLFSVAKDLSSAGAVHRAAATLSTGLEQLAAALDVSPRFLCLWKLAGDMCTFSRSLPDDAAATVAVPAVLRDPRVPDAAGHTLLAAGAYCYKRCLHLGETAEAWADLAVNLLAQATQERAGAAAAAAGLAPPSAALEALYAAKKAVSAEPQSSDLWNMLGVVAAGAGNFALSQHAFIRAIDLARHNAEGWVNLGVVYLCNNHVELAHHAFTHAQSLDPGMARSWVGQALVAERLAHPEALDLFRHSFELFPHPQAAIGFAFRVVAALRQGPAEHDATLAGIRSLEAACVSKPAAGAAMSDVIVSPWAGCGEIPRGYEKQYIVQATVALQRYVHSQAGCNDTQAHNLLGLLQERDGFVTNAAQSFQSALRILAKQHHGGTSAVAARIQAVKANLARVLLAVRDFAGSVQANLESQSKNFAHLCTLAHALFRAGNAKEAFEVYKQAGEAAAAAGQHAYVAETFVAQGVIAFSCGDDNLAKQLLFKSVADPALCPRGLFAMCALALILGDANLATAALVEFPKLRAKTTRILQSDLIDQHLLEACLFAMQGHPVQAKRALTKLVHLRPDCGEAWSILSAFLCGEDCVGQASVDGDGRRVYDLSKANGIARATVLLHQTKHHTIVPISKQDDDLSLIETANGIIALSLLGSGDERSVAQAHRAAQKVVHADPESAAAWCTLACATFVRGTVEGKTERMGLVRKACEVAVGLIEKERLALGAPTLLTRPRFAYLESLRSWAEALLCEGLVVLGASGDAKSLHDAITVAAASTKIYEAQPATAALFHHVLGRAQILAKDVAGGIASVLQSLRLAPTRTATWLSLSSVYLSLNAAPAADFALRQALASCAPASPLRSAILLRLAALAHLTSNAALRSEAVVEAVKLDPTNPHVRFMLAVDRLGRDDLKGAQKELERVEELGGLPRVYLARVLHLRKITDKKVDVPSELQAILDKVLQ